MRLLLLLPQTLAFAALALAAPPQGGELAPIEVQEEIVLDVQLCPAENGYFQDPFQCDKYYECKDGVPTEHICPDGQAFKNDNPSRAQCEYLFNVDCELRPELQVARSSPNCPRANGYFAVSDSSVCDEFYYCADGVDAHNSCPPGLHFSKTSGNCAWKAQAKRVGCSTAKDKITTFGHAFECPVVDQHAAVAHPRYQNPEDCRNFFVCFNGIGPPRDSGCDLGLVFSDTEKACVPPNRVPECTTYYDDYFELYFANLFGAKADDNHVQQALILGITVPEAARPAPFGQEVKKPTFNGGRRRTTSKPRPVTQAPRITELAIEVQPAEEIPHRLSSPSRGGTRPSAAAALPTDAEAQAPQRKRRPGTRRRRPVKAKTTTTTTTTTTTPAPEEYIYDDEYYYDDSYYYDDNSTLPVEQEPSTTTTTTTTTTTPAPTTAAGRRRLRRPSRPVRKRPTEE